MRKFLLGLVSLLTLIIFAHVTPASAADGVTDGRCVYPTGSSTRYVCVYATFNDTNCTPNTRDNCSGLNGAKLVNVSIITRNETLYYNNGVPLRIDKYGNGTDDYESTPYTLNFQATGGGSWLATPSSSFRTDINRICIQVRVTSGFFNIGGVNPYGLSQSGACGILYP